MEAGALLGARAGRPAVGDAAHLLPSARESPAFGDDFSPGWGQVLVRRAGPGRPRRLGLADVSSAKRKRGMDLDVIGNNHSCHSGPADGAG